MGLSPEERDEVRTTARTLLERTCSTDRVREVTGSEPGFDADLWARFVELGWTAIPVEDRHGGGGCGMRDLAVILQELGRALAPSPFLASAVLATGALTAADNDELAVPRLTALADGSATGSVAFAAADGSYERERLTTTWRSGGGGIVLDGVSGFVLDADVADFLVIAARGEDGTPAVVLTDTGDAGLRCERVPMVDTTRRVFTVAFDAVAVPDRSLLCAPGLPAAALFDRVLALGVVAAAVDAVGVAERLLERTSAYARERVQFGQPIGAFQAVKHHCANMAVNVEAARATVNAATVQLDGDPAEWATAAGITASYVGPACSEVCALAMRVHGGIGFTWEHDLHLYLKRAKLDEVLFGRPSWHRRRLADAVFPTLMTA